MMAINPASCAAKQEHVQEKNRSRCAMRSACPSAQNNAMAVQQGRVARRREALAAVALGQGAAAASVATVIDAVSPSMQGSAAAAAPGKRYLLQSFSIKILGGTMSACDVAV